MCNAVQVCTCQSQTLVFSVVTLLGYADIHCIHCMHYSDPTYFQDVTLELSTITQYFKITYSFLIIKYSLCSLSSQTQCHSAIKYNTAVQPYNASLNLYTFYKLPTNQLCFFLADRTNGRAIATLFRLSVRLSVCDVMYCG